MRTKEEIINALKELKGNLKGKYKVKEIGIFGSAIREEQTGTSDIDLLVDFEEDADLFDFVRLAIFLEGNLNQKVDVVPKRALREEIKESVLKEVVPI